MFKVHSSQLSQAILQELLSDGPYRVSLCAHFLELISLCQSCLYSSCFPAIDLSHGPASQGPAGPAAATGLTKLARPVALTPIPGRSKALRCDRSIAGTPLSWNVCPLPDRHQAPALAGQTSSASPCKTNVSFCLSDPECRNSPDRFCRYTVLIKSFLRLYNIHYRLLLFAVGC